MYRLSVALTAVSIVACAHTPKPKPSMTPPDAASPTSRSAVSAQAALPTKNDAPARQPSVDPVNVNLLKQGYHTAIYRGHLVYCRTEQLTGSRFKSEVCLSETQILDEEKRARDQMNSPQHNRCVGPDCG